MNLEWSSQTTGVAVVERCGRYLSHPPLRGQTQLGCVVTIVRIVRLIAVSVFSHFSYDSSPFSHTCRQCSLVMTPANRDDDGSCFREVDILHSSRFSTNCISKSVPCSLSSVLCGVMHVGQIVAGPFRSELIEHVFSNHYTVDVCLLSFLFPHYTRRRSLPMAQWPSPRPLFNGFYLFQWSRSEFIYEGKSKQTVIDLTSLQRVVLHALQFRIIERLHKMDNNIAASSDTVSEWVELVGFLHTYCTPPSCHSPASSDAIFIH